MRAYSGWLRIVYIIQTHTNWTMSDLTNALPEPVKSLHKLPMPWDFVFGPNKEEAEVRRTMGKIEDDEFSDTSSHIFMLVMMKTTTTAMHGMSEATTTIRGIPTKRRRKMETKRWKRVTPKRRTKPV